MMVYGIWTFVAALVAFIISAVAGKMLIPFLRRLKFGQTILEEGPNWHKSKQGTPVMGGLMFIIAIAVAGIISTIIYLLIGNNFIELYFSNISKESFGIFACLFLALGNGLIGFVDDFTKVVKKRNLGLTPKQKLVFQFLVAGAYLAIMALSGNDTVTIIPFIGEVDFGIFYYIISIFAIVGMTNAVNITDGIDGLDGSVTFFVSIAFMLISCMMSALGLTAFCAVCAGACLGFLVWNFHPAKVFMGDTGSLFLGGLVCGLAYALDMPILLILIGFIYIAEILSVVLQVTYFKLTHGKRLFKMSPIHHHFEMSGWSEVKIVAVFSAITAVLGAGAFALVYFGGCVNFI